MEFLNIGAGELLLVFLVALLVLGPRKLPEIGRSLGKGIREFRQATSALTAEFTASMDDVREPIREVKNIANETLQGTVNPTHTPSINSMASPTTNTADATPSSAIASTMEAPPVAAVSQKCPNCGIDNPTGNRFCGSCGSALGSSNAASQQAGNGQSS
jgi:sec-independent protein translocase protein TatA